MDALSVCRYLPDVRRYGRWDGEGGEDTDGEVTVRAVQCAWNYQRRTVFITPYAYAMQCNAMNFLGMLMLMQYVQQAEHSRV